MTVHVLLWTSITLFALTAAGGLVMAGIRVSGGRNPPAWLAMGHGLLAGAGLTLLLFGAFTVGLPRWTNWGVVLLAIAAVGGVYLNLGYQEQRRLLPTSILYAHAGLAVIGFLLVIAGALA